jgi:formylglycine-generating enzyme required for sulfatase activity
MWRKASGMTKTENGARRGFRPRPWVALCLAGLLAACSRSAPEPAIGDTTYTNSMGMAFARIPAGAIRMEDGRITGHPPDPTVITQPFYMGKYEVTQAEWNAVMEVDDPDAPWWDALLRGLLGVDESAKKGLVPVKEGEARYPVTHVSWDEVQGFIRRLNKKEGTNKYRLPTEAEWEYAARADTLEKFFFGNDDADLEKYAWTTSLHTVGQKLPNPWGLYDMYGNAMEWAHNVWNPNFEDTKKIDFAGPSDEYRYVSERRLDWWAGCTPIYRWHSRTVMDPVRVYQDYDRNYKEIHRVIVSHSGAGADPDRRYATVGFRLVFSPTIHENDKTDARRKAAIREQERVFKPCQKENKGKYMDPVPECHIENCRGIS